MAKPHIVQKKGELWRFKDRAHYINYLTYVLQSGRPCMYPVRITHTRITA